jgi:O-antigen ligase
MIERLKQIAAFQWYHLLLSLLIFTFCFAPNSIALFVILLSFFTAVQAVKGKMKFKISTVSVGFLVFFLAYFFGTFFTNHLADALHSLERKMVFVAFPILFSFRFDRKLNLQPIALGLISGVLICSVLGLIHSFYTYQVHGDFNNSFGASTFSYIHHPTYFSAFLLISFLFALEGYTLKWRYFNRYSVVLYFLFTLIMQFFCFSFAGLLYLFLVLIYLGYMWMHQRFSRLIFYLCLAALPIIPVVIYKSNIHIQIVIDDALTDLQAFVSNPKSILTNHQETYTGNQVRLILWTVSMQEFQAHPFGVGTSNLDDAIGVRLRKYGLNDLANQNYNSHNQYLQVAVEIGILGLILFLGLLGVIFSYAIKWKNTLLFLICGNLAFNCIFESMLQRQSGIVFYTFVLMLVYMLNFDKTLRNFNQK